MERIKVSYAALAQCEQLINACKNKQAREYGVDYLRGKHARPQFEVYPGHYTRFDTPQYWQACELRTAIDRIFTMDENAQIRALPDVCDCGIGDGAYFEDHAGNCPVYIKVALDVDTCAPWYSGSI